ncbi:hypothetical protein [Rhizobium sp. BK176]|uniref:hypothetical protein n=1 Tax=Rhizobium sp. BK176 TaxID=2587071 RepID=UPI002168D229|nr:hypothetical protein [Rhizobium sp. BK176]MCS4089442.1 hypothetical protein [Rhizobium sp. BK176]
MKLDYVHAFKAFAPKSEKVVTWVLSNEGLPFPVKFVQQVLDVDLTWVRKVHGDVVVCLGDRPLRKVRTISERFEFLDLLHDMPLRATAQRTADDWNLTADNEVDVSIRVWLEDVPTFGLAPGGNDQPAPRYYAMSNLQQPVIPWYEGIDLSKTRNHDAPLLTERHSLTKIWSSRWSASECEAARSRFELRVREKVRTVGDPAYLSDMIDI